MRKDFNLLFDAMKNDISVMYEHGDNERSLYNELLTCDMDIYNYYLDFYLYD